MCIDPNEVVKSAQLNLNSQNHRSLNPSSIPIKNVVSVTTIKNMMMVVNTLRINKLIFE